MTKSRGNGFAGRFAEALVYAGIYGIGPNGKKLGSQRSAAKRFSFEAPFLGRLLNGTSLPSYDTAVEIAKVCGVSTTWLIDGIGPMVASEDYNQAISRAPPDVREAIDAILEKYRRVQ